MTDQEAWESRNAVAFLPNVQQLFEVHQDSAHNMRVSHMKARLSCGGVVLVDVVVESLRLWHVRTLQKAKTCLHARPGMHAHLASRGGIPILGRKVSKTWLYMVVLFVAVKS